MSQATFTRLAENDYLVSSGSDLLDSFYYPLQTTTCLQNEPVVDVETILQSLEHEKSCSPLPQTRKTPRGKAVQRLKRTLKMDRIQSN